MSIVESNALWCSSVRLPVRLLCKFSLAIACSLPLGVYRQILNSVVKTVRSLMALITGI